MRAKLEILEHAHGVERGLRFERAIRGEAIRPCATIVRPLMGESVTSSGQGALR